MEVHETTRGSGRSFSFKVPGEGVPWARPRFVRTATGMRSFTQSNVANHEQLVRLVFEREVKEQGIQWFPLQGEVSMWVRFLRVPPKGMGKRRTAEALAGQHHPTTKPDLDNLVKCVKDALNGHAYRDDAQIVSLHATKAYGPVPGTVIVLHDGYLKTEGVA